MGIFGNDEEQDARLDEIERQLRDLADRIGEVAVDVGQCRVELLQLQADVEDSVRSSELDPVFAELNAAVTTARAKLGETKVAAEESWAQLRKGSDDAVESLRTSLEAAAQRLEEPAAE